MKVTVPASPAEPVSLIPTEGFVSRDGMIYLPADAAADLWIESHPSRCNATDGFPVFRGGPPLSAGLLGGQAIYAISAGAETEVRLLIPGLGEVA